MNSNTSNTHTARDGTVHNSASAAKIHDLASSQPGGIGQQNTAYDENNLTGTGIPSNTGSSNTYISRDGDSHNTQAGARMDNATGSSNSGLGSNSGMGSNTGSNSTYVSRDGDQHSSRMGAAADNMTGNSSNQYSGSNTYSSGTTGNNNYRSTDGDLHNSRAGAAADNMTGSSNRNTGDNYMSKDGDMHSSRTGAAVDNMTGSDHYRSTQAGPNTDVIGTTGSGIGSTQHGAPGAYGSSGSGRNHMSNDGDMHRTSAGAGLDSATNRSGTHATTGLSNSGESNFSSQKYDPATSSHAHMGTGRTNDSSHSSTGASGYNSNDAHNSNTGEQHKPTMMDKVKGTVDSISGKMSKDQTKVEHGQQVKEGLIDSKSDKHHLA